MTPSMIILPFYRRREPMKAAIPAPERPRMIPAIGTGLAGTESSVSPTRYPSGDPVR